MTRVSGHRRRILLFRRRSSWTLQLLSNERGWADVSDGEAIYFCGNSLGLLSKQARQYVMQELDVWSSRSVLFSLIV